MASLRLPLLLLGLPVLVGLVLTRSPFMLAATAPSASQPWADGPMKLITTPQHETGKVRERERDREREGTLR